jgi:predicted nucleic acid-binding protein
MDYLDTCVLVAYYCPDPLSAAAQEAFRRCADPTISPLVELEFCCAVARKRRAGQMDADAAGHVIASFRSHVAEDRYQVTPVTSADYERARDWIAAFSAPLRALDALHLAAAAANGLRLLTADRTLADCARKFGVRCRLIA